MIRLVPNLSVAALHEYLGQRRNWDLLLACSSFEERCTGGCKLLAEGGAGLDHAIILSYRETDANGAKAGWQKVMLDLLAGVSSDVRVFDTDSVSRPSDGIKGFRRYLRETSLVTPNTTVLIDISVFTKPYFFLLLKTLRSEYSLDTFQVVYTEPKRYGRELGTTGAVVLTEGLDRTETIPGFTGSSSGTEEVLIVMMGFEGNRSLDVFRAVNPSTTYAINGFPSFRPGWDRVSLDANLRFLRESGAYERLYYASAIDPFETEETLGQIVDSARDRNADSSIVIAPLGSKTQAFGALLYAIRNPAVKVIYPFPSRFRTDYSHGIGPSWIMQASFGTPKGAGC